MTLIDGDKIITTQLYDDEYEEFIEEKMSIIDYVNAYTDEGVTTADDVLDKIRAEIDKARFVDKDTRICKNALASGLEVAMQIIDKYKGESEKTDI